MFENKGRILPLLLIFLAVLVGVGVYLWREYPDRIPVSMHEIIESIQDKLPPAAELLEPAEDKAPPAKEVVVSPNQVTLYLHNGGVVTGELVQKTDNEVTLRWEYGDVAFHKSEIKHLVKGSQIDGEEDIVLPEVKGGAWPYAHDVVFRLMNGTIIDATLQGFDAKVLNLTQDVEGGGLVEFEIPLSEFDQIMFRPVYNERSNKIRERLEKLFPEMRFDKEGLFTIVTDSTRPVARKYRQTVRELATEWYLTFHTLAKGRSPSVQHYIVIFDDWGSYIEYAATDGIPGWFMIGYFDPTNEVLYCFNMVGERFSALLEEVYLGGLREQRDTIMEQLKGSKYELSFRGQLSEFLQKFESTHVVLRQLYWQTSADLLRHELTHAMFNNWRLQGIMLSQMPEEDKETVEKKREYLEADDIEKKRNLLDGLLGELGHEEMPEVQAANSWFVEGLAGYMEPTPVGGVNTGRLADAQSALSNQEIFPLEFIDTFRIGSFRGMTSGAMLSAYAQSWAFVHFFMHRYRDGFMVYLDRMAREQPEEGEETLDWLLDSIGKEPRPLEKEFIEYLEQFPPEDPSWLKRKQVFLDLRTELNTLVSRLWSRYR